MNLRAIFSPRQVAVIGATEKPGSVGRAVAENLLSFQGTVHWVNRKHPMVLGRRTLARVADLPAETDLAVIVTPAAAVPEVLRDCAAAGIPAAVIIPAGFRETGAAGVALEREVLGIARAAGMRLIGPNCLGVMVPGTGLNATFATTLARVGNIAFLSQSGALCTAILDWSFRAGLGFSAFVSTGSMLDVGWADLLRHFAQDEATHVLALYMESAEDARAFVQAARQVSVQKPIILLKAGRTEAAAKAAASHTGALTGSDAVFDAACARAGALRVDSISELFQTAELLGSGRIPTGGRLAILTNAGGPGALAVDMLVRHGGVPAEFSPTTLAALDACLPAPWSHGNPADILGDADAARYARALEIVAADPGNDGLLIILTPQSMTDSTAVAESVVRINSTLRKPLLTSWMGGGSVEPGRQRLAAAGIPGFEYPDTAARIFARVSRHLHSVSMLPPEPSAENIPAPENATRLLMQVVNAGRVLLTETESKALLTCLDLPVLETRTALTEAEAVTCAEALGYPVVLKLCSQTLTHKTDVGGVRLDLPDAAAVRTAWHGIRDSVTRLAGPQHFGGVTVQRMISSQGVELILGAKRDAQFGPVVLFGSGGVRVHVLDDTALDLAPLSPAQAMQLIARTRAHRLLQGVRGGTAADVPRLAELVARFSRILTSLPQISEMEINPLLISGHEILALDARVMLSHEAAA